MIDYSFSNMLTASSLPMGFCLPQMDRGGSIVVLSGEQATQIKALLNMSFDTVLNNETLLLNLSQRSAPAPIALHLTSKPKIFMVPIKFDRPFVSTFNRKSKGTCNMQVSRILTELGLTTDNVTDANCESLILSGIGRLKSGRRIESLEQSNYSGDIFGNELLLDVEKKRQSAVRAAAKKDQDKDEDEETDFEELSNPILKDAAQKRREAKARAEKLKNAR
jgi:hypothetical protein